MRRAGRIRLGSKLAKAGEMREIDRRAIEDYSIPGIILMEHAATAVFEVIKKEFSSPVRTCVICGHGNNGGDGWAIARLLFQAGWPVTLFHQGLETSLPPDAQKNKEISLRLGVKAETWGKLLEHSEALKDYPLVIDALLGTGFRGRAEGDYGRLIENINRSERMVISVDIPSGLEADTGNVNGSAVMAKKTVTFGLPKVGLLVYPGRSFAGEIISDPIGLPNELLTGENLKHFTYRLSDVEALNPKRDAETHKGRCGHILIIGGSAGLTGAPILAGMAALRSGAGLVTLALRDDLVVTEKPPELMTKTWSQIIKRLKTTMLSDDYDILIIGPGLSKESDGRELLFEVLKQESIPKIIDADALNLLSEEKGWWGAQARTKVNGPLILTPHPGEMARLTGLSVSEVQKNRVELVREKAALWQGVLVLKGAGTVVGSPDGSIYINSTGNPGMATGGMGDILTGVIGALLGQGLSEMEGACLGVYMHGAAADLAAEELGYTGMLAGDLLSRLPLVFK